MFKVFSSKLDIRLAISLVSTYVNLNKMNVQVKNLKIKRQPVHLFGLTEPNKTMRIMCGKIITKHRQQMKFCNSHLTCNIFNHYMRRFFFGLVYTY